LDFLEAIGHAFCDEPAVFSREHHRGPDDGFLAVLRRCTSANFRPDSNLGHIFHENRLHSGAEFEWNICDVVRGSHPANGADD
jgi:hypothetical protein